MAETVDVLGRIVAQKRHRVAERVRATPMAALTAVAAPTTRSLRRALAGSSSRFILECKKASPSGGVLRPDLDPTAIGRAYAGVADAVSVVTDEAFFGGSLEMLLAVRKVVDAPILCKDFVVSPYQVVEARAYGADAVLIMLSVLGDREALECLRTARQLGMDCLVEVHDERELERALALPASDAAIIGINNRNLRTLEIDLATTVRLARRVPHDRILVAESGIQGRADVERLAPHVDAFLVGSSLMKRPDVGDAARELVTGRVKVCGLARWEEGAAVAAAGARFGGLDFSRGARRAVAREEAVAIAATLPAVGLFAGQHPGFVAETARSLGLAAVQLGGGEDAAFVAEVRRGLPEACELWQGAPASADADRRVVREGARAEAGELGECVLQADDLVAARTAGAWALDVQAREHVSEIFLPLRAPNRRLGSAS